MDTSLEADVISLLWRDQPAHTRASDAAWEDDLGLAPIVRALSSDGRYASQVRMILTGLCTDLATIGYRQDILEDVLRLPALAARLEAVLSPLASLAYNAASRWDAGGVFQVAARLSELELYVDCVRSLLEALDAAHDQLMAAGWLELHSTLRSIAATSEFQALAAKLPALRAHIERAGSVTIGINLDAQLHPESATLLGIHAGRFDGPRSLLGRLLSTNRDTQNGVTPLRPASERQTFGPDRQLFQDLNHLLEEVTVPVAQALARYGHMHGGPLAALESEIAFYVGAARLIRDLQAAGHMLCRPQVAAPTERVCHIRDGFNLELLLRLRAHPPQNGTAPDIVPNDITFDDAGRIFILTGPNRGGKTTFTRAIGQAQVLCQAGLYVPGSAARISPVDAIYTLFPEAEQAQTGMGRLDEEATRLAAIFRDATNSSLVLLNEPLSSTSPAEALELARDVLCGLRLLGVRAVLVTHLHDLAREASALNAAVSGTSRLASLVAGVGEGGDQFTRRTYRIAFGVPVGHSYAADVALQHGLHLSQITRTLQERGLR